ncbi:MAG: peptidoglycan DD-metalloendopeptidase family protein [Gammaproteobacteria bacterium]
MNDGPVRCLAVLCCAALLTGCAGALTWNPSGAPTPAPQNVTVEPIPRQYVVKPGDTLYSIAWRYGLDYHDVAAWNHIGSAYLIKPGRTLALAAPAQALAARPSIPSRTASTAPTPAPGPAPSSGPLRWAWPARGAVVRMYHADDPLSKGIDISGTPGQDIYAAAPGKVVYTGSAIIGYGKLIIIKNSEQFLSAYADNDEMLVQEGDMVHAGERIASMGLDRDGHPLLHFEIRYNGKPVNPLSYLPPR